MTVLSGLDCLDEKLVKGRRVGLVSNQTGLNRHYTPTRQVIEQAGGRVAALFGPEHGYYGVVQDAEAIDSGAEQEVPVYSLYRAVDMHSDDQAFVPPPGSLDNLDLLVFDIQDVGVRYYTYPTTLGLLLECTDLPVLVIDRPNPLGGEIVEGPGLEEGLSTFVGRYSLPVRHGLTIGEWARLVNRQYLGDRGNLQVVQMQGWRRDMNFAETGLPWIWPSPNLPTLETARVYPGTCLLEGTNLSVGRGTTRPFEVFGAPWVNPAQLAGELNRQWWSGVHFRETYFKPTFDRFTNEVCGGVQLHPTGEEADAVMVRLGLIIVAALLRLYPEQFEWLPQHFDRLIGSSSVREALVNAPMPETLEDIFAYWAEQENSFKRQRRETLLYQ